MLSVLFGGSLEGSGMTQVEADDMATELCSEGRKNIVIIPDEEVDAYLAGRREAVFGE